jgi:hypothetical protein
LLVRHLKCKSNNEHGIPRAMLELIGSRPARAAASLLPGSFYSHLSQFIP